MIMSRLRLDYEILVSGIYPFEGKFEKNGFTMSKNHFNNELISTLVNEGVMYLNPLITNCASNDDTGSQIYLTLQKTEFIDINYNEGQEYNVDFTNKFLQDLDLFAPVCELEKAIVLEVNNDIKFPVKMVKAYDENDHFITVLADIMRLNVPVLIGCDQNHILEAIKRQKNRLNSGFSYEKIEELASNNVFFKNALSMYHSSFSISDHQVGFTLLIVSLESLLGLDTYGKPETCSSCGQKKYKIAATISENVSFILMDSDESIKKRMKKFYTMRSKFVHAGKAIEKTAEQELQEYVRKVLLMYWYASMYKSTFDHKELMGYLRSEEYRDNVITQAFLTALSNSSFEDKRKQIIENIIFSTKKIKN